MRLFSLRVFYDFVSIFGAAIHRELHERYRDKHLVA